MLQAPVNFEPLTVNSRDLINKSNIDNLLVNQFWTHWNTDYFINLPPWKGPDIHDRSKVGAVVLIHEDPRLKWPIRVVTET